MWFKCYYRSSIKENEYVVELEEFHKALNSIAPGSPEASTHLTTWDVMMAGWAATMLDGDWALSLISHRVRRGRTRGKPASEGRQCLLCLSGCCVPLFILAQADSGRYRLVTDAYIHDVMGRELVDKLDP